VEDDATVRAHRPNRPGRRRHRDRDPGRPSWERHAIAAVEVRRDRSLAPVRDEDDPADGRSTGDVARSCDRLPVDAHADVGVLGNRVPFAQRTAVEGVQARPVQDVLARRERAVRHDDRDRRHRRQRDDRRGDRADAGDEIERLQRRGLTVSGVVRDGDLVGLIGIGDELKTDAAETVQRIKDAGITPVMITGDNERTAQAVAEEVGIERVMADVLPDEKREEIGRLQDDGERITGSRTSSERRSDGSHRVAMVGDGINDAPALTQADIGIAIGAGTDIAIESADIVLMGERLGGVMDAYEIGEESYRKTRQNLATAFAFNGIGVAAATTGLVHPCSRCSRWYSRFRRCSQTASAGNFSRARASIPSSPSKMRIVPKSETDSQQPIRPPRRSRPLRWLSSDRRRLPHCRRPR